MKYLLGIFFKPEDGGNMFQRMLVNYQTIQHYILKTVVPFTVTAVRTSVNG
jgi:hypothetical protein